jgi:type I restriction enzyme S subunit
MKQDLKQTAIGDIPADWEVVTLGQISQRIKAKNDGSEHEILTISAKTGFVRQADRYSKYMAGKSVENYTLLKQGEFSYNKGNSLTYPFGCIYRQDDYTQALVPNVYISFKLSASVDSEFFKHLFLEGTFIGRLKRYISSGVRGNGLLNVNPEDFFSLELALPPLLEQQKIAKILSTVDEKMAVIDEQLAQTQELKKGLMQRLLTKGIGHTAFKDSPLGEIPQSWMVESLETICDDVFLGLTSSVHYVESGGFPLIRTSDISKGRLSFDDVRFISEEQHRKLTKKRLTKRGDVLVSKSGSLGTCVIVDSDAEFSTYESIITIQPQKSILGNTFLLHILKDSNVQKRMLGAKVGGIVGHLNLMAFRKLIIPLPPLPEQHQIAEILTTVDDKLQVLTDKKAQYQELKRGLMQQLLTGQRRVRVALPEEALA